MSVRVDKSSMMSGKKSYWNYLCDCLASNKYLKDGLHFVRSLTEVGLLYTSAADCNIIKELHCCVLCCIVSHGTAYPFNDELSGSSCTEVRN